jgi:hypothetical protein
MSGSLDVEADPAGAMTTGQALTDVAPFVVGLRAP